jgi:hypothetical protein
MKYEIDIDLDELFRKELEEKYNEFCVDLEMLLAGEQQVPVFSSDSKTEAAALTKMIEAIRVVHNWYSTPDQTIYSEQPV